MNTTRDEREKHYNKTNEIIARFKNGRKLYRTSALFNQIVQMLVRDIDPLEVIDKLITIVEDATQALEQQIHRDPKPFIINNDTEFQKKKC